MVVITTKKPDEEVFESLRNFNAKKVAVVSCGTCAALCQTGGTEGLAEWEKKLKENGFEVTAGIVSEDVCDNRVMKKDFRKIDDELKESDAILTLSCGLGVQSIVTTLEKKYPNIPVLVSNNTEFMGMTERIGRFYMRCQGCGDCLLNETGGICPITTCAKALMNGPCGGMVEGKCEVGGYERDCGWVLIFNRLKEIGRLDLFSKLREARDWSDSGHQREVVFR
ncbi:MAG: 5,10-methylenetetrahydrofolate reductase [Promethearchaeota archaeon]|nr:MAG: 5,10-methylenetetrahydrofolate reductase [Candidatus Lokiarchaeota archaeon]